VRQGLRGFLELLDDFEIVGEGKTGIDAVKLAETLKPDIVLLDLMMPEMDGAEATRRILLTDPKMKILILSSFSDESTIFPVLQAGAMGFVLKDISPDELAEALRDTYKGKTRLHPDIAAKLINKIKNPGTAANDALSLSGTLTGRELEVLKLIGRGLSNKEIAGEMSISPMTVKTHVSNILGKLNLYDRTQAAIFAIKQGLVADT
ncbi:MAG: response regulator transcription factor, partial [Spirochaetales bacterium]